MKTKKLILIVLGIILAGCSIEDPEESLSLEKNVLETESIKSGNAVPEITLGDIVLPDGGDDDGNEELNLCHIRIRWNSLLDLKGREAIRKSFEAVYGKTTIELTIDSFEEIWYFNIDLANQSGNFLNCNLLLHTVQNKIDITPNITVVTESVTEPESVKICENFVTVVYDDDLSDTEKETIRLRFENDFGKLSNEKVFSETIEAWSFDLDQANQSNPLMNFEDCNQLKNVVEMEVDATEGVEVGGDH